MAIFIRRSPPLRKKTDPSFSAIDVIRIFALHLTKEEKKVTIAFFYFLLPLLSSLNFIKDVFFISRIPKNALTLYIRVFFLIRRKTKINFVKWLHLFFPDIDLPLWIKIQKQLKEDFG